MHGNKQGRAGRRQDEALIIYVAQSTALDQYVVKHPEYFSGQSPEEVRIHPDNMIILMDHLKCAAFELPFTTTDTYGEFSIQELLAYLEEEGVLVKTSTANGIGCAIVFLQVILVCVLPHRKMSIIIDITNTNENESHW